MASCDLATWCLRQVASETTTTTTHTPTHLPSPSHPLPSLPHPPPPPPKAQTGCSVCVGDFCCAFKLSTMDGVGNETGSAMRRRQRRLRSWLRHERMTVAMALAESTHHTSRGQKNGGAGMWGHEQNCTAKTHTQAGAVQPRRRARRGPASTSV